MPYRLILQAQKNKLILLSIIVFLLYLVTMPQEIALEDDGSFTLAAFYNGIAHPPGYPLYTLLGYLVTHLPLGNPAANMHALSALFGALSSLVLGFIMLSLTGKQAYAYTAMIALAISKGFWSQAIIAEVYTLNVFIFSLTLLIALEISKTKEGNSEVKKRQYFFFGLFIGLGLTNHWPLYILGGSGIAVLLLPFVNKLIHKWNWGLSGLVIGLLPYIWLFINSNQDPFISYWGPLNNFEDFLSFIKRDQYSATIDFSPASTINDKISYILFILQHLFTQHGYIGGFIALFGLYQSFIHLNKITATGLLTTYVAGSIFLALILGYEYNEKTRIIFPPYLLISYIIGAIYVAFALGWIHEQLKKRVHSSISSIVLALLFVQALIPNIETNYRMNYTWAETYAKKTLDSLKPNAILFVHDDITTTTIGYLRYVKNYRLDVTVINENGLLFTTRLFNPHTTNLEQKKHHIKSFLAKARTPVYFTLPPIEGGYINRWLVYEYNSELSINQERLELNSNLINYLNYVFSEQLYTDPWTLEARAILRDGAIPHLINRLITTNNPLEKTKLKKYLYIAAENLYSISNIISTGTQLNVMEQLGGTKKWIQQGWILFKHETNRENKAHFIRTLGDLRITGGDYISGIKYYKKSLRLWDHPKNSTHAKLNIIKKECVLQQLTASICASLNND